MSAFLSLPRELRDMIYTAVVLHRLPVPSLASLTPSTDPYISPWGLYDPYDPNPNFYHDHDGIHFSVDPPPNTCANLLATNRQINNEMSHVIERARRKNQLVARMDCLVLHGLQELEHYISWVSVPLVKTGDTGIGKDGGRKRAGKWAPIVRRLGGWSSPGGYGIRNEDWEEGKSRVILEGLCVDVRLSSQPQSRNPTAGRPSSGEQTMWAICAALKKALKHDFEDRQVSVELLVLNVVPASPQISTPLDPQQDPHGPRSLTLPSSTSPTSTSETQRNLDAEEAKKVAQSLISLWNKIWAREGANGRCYRSLLERIQRVRVCVDGTSIRERDLGRELERGQMERRRIAMRVGW